MTSGSVGSGGFTDCFDPDHFDVVDGMLTPQPWMQLRPVGSSRVSGRAGSYAVTGGGNKNMWLQAMQRTWLNDSPINQYVYALVTRGGSQVVLQARSRGYLVVSTSQAKGIIAGPLVDVSWMGCGADIGRGGMLSVGTSACMIEQRQNSVTFPLLPHVAGWELLEPGESVTCKVGVRFVSEFWESAIIDGGNQELGSGFYCGETRLDMFALPALDV